MSEQPKTTDESRRRLVRAALAAPPLLATLSARPVHAVKGMSNMTSGDASNCRGDNRYGGMSPSFWAQPQGKTQVYFDNVRDAWSMCGFWYGKRRDGKDGTQWDHYKRGTRCRDVFGSSDGRRIREVLNEDLGDDFLHLIAGLFNARYFAAKAGNPSRTLYFFTEAEFWAMYYGYMPVPQPYMSLVDFIAYNYNAGPGSDCGNF